MRNYVKYHIIRQHHNIVENIVFNWHINEATGQNDGNIRHIHKRSCAQYRYNKQNKKSVNKL